MKKVLFYFRDIYLSQTANLLLNRYLISPVSNFEAYRKDFKKKKGKYLT